MTYEHYSVNEAVFFHTALLLDFKAPRLSGRITALRTLAVDSQERVLRMA